MTRRASSLRADSYQIDRGAYPEAVHNRPVEQLAPSNVPVYGSIEEGRTLWERCGERAVPVVAVRDARRGFIVRYDLSPLGRELSVRAVADLRSQVRRFRENNGTDTSAHPQSETTALGGEVGPIAGDLHEHTERRARRLASRVSAVVFDRDNWR